MNKLKKHLLLRDSSHLFFNSLGHSIKKLSSSYQITILLTETDLTPEAKKKLLILQSKNFIRGFFIIKNAKSSLRMFIGLKKLQKKLRSIEFDISISRTSFSVFDRFIDDNLLSNKCLRVVYHDKVTFLISDYLNIFLYDSEVLKILNRYYPNKKYYSKPKVISKDKFIKALNSRIIFYKIVPKIINYIFNAIIIKKINFLRNTVFRRYAIPFLFTGKFYPTNFLSKVTQLTDGNIDLLLLTDPLEVDLHRYIYKSKKVKVIQIKNSLESNCNCSIKYKKKNAVLSPLSGIGDVDLMPKKYLDLYLKPLQITLKESGASEIHLRVHPRETGKWQYQLCQYLIENKIPCRITEPNKPISDVVCNYIGVAGFASGVLRDARASCNKIFVVGFEELSKLRYANPTIVFGKGEGIGWIYSGNKYDKSIFDIKSNYSNAKNSLTEKINKEFLRKNPPL